MNENERKTTTIIFLYLDGWEIARIMGGEEVHRVLRGYGARHEHKPERVAVPAAFQSAFDEVLEP